MKINQIKSWGVDVSNVILRNLPESLQRFHEQENSCSEEISRHLKLIPEALLGIQFLTQKVGIGNVWIIAKAEKKQIQAIRLAFNKLKFYNVTGLKRDQVLFVSERQDKIPVIKCLELEGYVDDRGEIIHSVQNFVKCPLWFCPDLKESDRWARQMNYSVRVISGWKQLMEMYH